MSGLRELLRKWQNKRDELARLKTGPFLQTVYVRAAILELEPRIARKAYEQEFGRKPVQVRRKKK